MPAGNVTLTLRARSTAPCPLHVGHGVLMTRPAPLQRGQVDVNITKPRALETCPEPRHCAHASTLEPALAPLPAQSEHAAGARTLTSLLHPNAASRSVRRACTRRSPPLRWRPPPPENISAKRSCMWEKT